MKKEIEITDLVKEFETSIDAAIKKLTQDPGKVRLGYDNAAITSQRQILSGNLSHLNRMLDLYLQIFEGKARNINTVNEVLSIPFSLPQEQIEGVLKERYLEHIQYNYKHFGFRLAFVVKLFDYPAIVETSIKELINESSMLLNLGTDQIEFFDEKQGMFVMDETDEQEIIDRNTAYADADSLKDIIYSALFVKALKCAKEQSPEYYFTELPEVPWALLDKISFDRANIYSDSLEVNFNNWVSRWVSNEKISYDITVVGIDERQTPLIKVNDSYYRAVNVSVMSVLKTHDVVDFRELAKLENREALIKLVILDLSSNMGMLEPYQPR